MIRKFNQRGQAMAEMILILPLFVILAGGVMATLYMSWQGIKVQQAANMAARMEGQERVAGGGSEQQIQQVNGLSRGIGDQDPTKHLQQAQLSPETDGDGHEGRGDGDLRVHKGPAPSAGTVYGKFYKAVEGMFSAKERTDLSIPQPTLGLNTDQIKVVRVVRFPSVLGHQIPAQALDATAYGGEDPHMFALPRWGCVAGQDCSQGQNLYWKSILKKE